MSIVQDRGMIINLKERIFKYRDLASFWTTGSSPFKPVSLVLKRKCWFLLCESWLVWVCKLMLRSGAVFKSWRCVWKNRNSASVSETEKASFMFHLLQSLNTNSFLWDQVLLLFATVASFSREIVPSVSSIYGKDIILMIIMTPFQAVCYYYC